MKEYKTYEQWIEDSRPYIEEHLLNVEDWQEEGCYYSAGLQVYLEMKSVWDMGQGIKKELDNQP